MTAVLLRPVPKQDTFPSVLDVSERSQVCVSLRLLHPTSLVLQVRSSWVCLRVWGKSKCRLGFDGLQVGWVIALCCSMNLSTDTFTLNACAGVRMRSS